jgi:peptide/nickel transport system permease protein
MIRFTVRRIGQMLFVLFAVSVLTFFIFNVMPAGDPAIHMAGRHAQDAQLERIRDEWGFDEPVYVQYVKTMGKIFDGSLVSYSTQQNVTDELKDRAPRTFALAIGAALLWMAVAVALGVFTAVRAGRFSDRLVTILALVGISMPVFWIGALMNHYLGFEWELFPNGGYVPIAEDPWQWFNHLIMPWVALSILFIGVYSRVLRSNILDTMNDDFVRTARAKGLSERHVMRRHVLRNSLIPIVTLWGLDFGAVLGGGTILTETVFEIQGVGQYAFESVDELDVPPVLAITMYGAFFIVLLSTVVDILYAALDPRIRLS